MGSLDGKGQITVCVGNYGYYNEGELRDTWIDLPVPDSELKAFLLRNGLYDAEHEETYVSDYDGIPLGMGYGGAFSEYASLEDLNLLARVMEATPDWQLEQLRGAFEAGADQPGTVIGVANLVAQPDELPYSEYLYQPDDPSNGVTSREEALALTEVEERGGLENLDRNELERHFDVEAWGGDLRIEDVNVGDEGWCWKEGVEGPETDAFATVSEAAEGMGVGVGDPDAEVRVGERDSRKPADIPAGEVRSILRRELAYAPEVADPIPDDVAADERTLLLMAGQLDDFDREAVGMYMDMRCAYPHEPEALASVIAGHEQIDYRHYTSRALDMDLRLGETLLDELGVESLSDEMLKTYFDYEGYGCEAAFDYGLGEHGYLWGDMPDERRYSREDLEEMYPDLGQGPDGIGHESRDPSPDRRNDDGPDEDGVSARGEGPDPVSLLAPTAAALIARAVAAGEQHAALSKSVSGRRRFL